MTGKSCPCANGTPARSRPRPAPSCPRRGTPARTPGAATPAYSTACSQRSAPAARWPRSAGRRWPGCWSTSGAAGPGDLEPQPRRRGRLAVLVRRRRLPAPVLPASAERRREHHDATRAVPRPAIDRALSRRDGPLREKTLWRMLYETAARAGSEVLALTIEDPGLDARRAPVRSKGGDTGWIFWGSGAARRPGPVPGDWTGPARLRPRPDPVHPAHRVAAAPASPLRSGSPRRARHRAAADHGQDPAPEPAHRDAVRLPRCRSRR